MYHYSEPSHMAPSSCESEWEMQALAGQLYAQLWILSLKKVKWTVVNISSHHHRDKCRKWSRQQKLLKRDHLSNSKSLKTVPWVIKVPKFSQIESQFIIRKQNLFTFSSGLFFFVFNACWFLICTVVLIVSKQWLPNYLAWKAHVPNHGSNAKSV